MRLLRTVLLSSTLLMGVTFGADEVVRSDVTGSPRVVEAEVEVRADEFLAAVAQLKREKATIIDTLTSYVTRGFGGTVEEGEGDPILAVLKAMRTQIRAAKSNLVRLRAAATEQAEREAAAAEELAALREEKAAVEAELAGVRAELEKVRAAQAEKEGELEAASARAAELTAQLEAVRREAAAELEAAELRIAELEEQLRAAKGVSEEEGRLTEALEAERVRAAAEIDAREEAIAEKASALEAARLRIQALEGEVGELAAEVERLSARSKTTGSTAERVLALRATAAGLQTERDVAEEGSDDDDEFGPAVGGLSPDRRGLDVLPSGFGDDEADADVDGVLIGEAEAIARQIEGVHQAQRELELQNASLQPVRTAKVAELAGIASRIGENRAQAEEVVQVIAELEASLAAAQKKIDTRPGTTNRRRIVAEGETAKAEIEPNLTAAREARARLDVEFAELNRASEASREEIEQITRRLEEIAGAFQRNQAKLTALEEAAAKVGGEA